MSQKNRFSLWKLLKWPSRFLYAIGLGPVYGRLVLLLTTTGRKHVRQVKIISQGISRKIILKHVPSQGTNVIKY
jgi:hypothetical protein